MKLKLQGKLLLIIISLLSVLGIATIGLAQHEIERIAMYEMEQKLNGDLELGYSLLDEKHPGEWRVEGGRLYKGDDLIGDGTAGAGNYALVDEILKRTNSVATIFMKNENLKLEQKDGYIEAPYIRVSTSVADKNGNRAVGTKISKQVADMIEKEGHFTGEANVAGKPHQARYVAIKNQSGQIVGIWFVGIPKDYILKEVNKVSLNFTIISGIIILIGIGISTIFIRSITRKIRTIVSVISEMEAQNLKVHCDIKSNDEIGDISNSLNNLINTLSDLIHKVRESSGTVSDTSTLLSDITSQTTIAVEEVASSIEHIAKGAMDQAKGLEEGTIKVGDLASRIEHVAIAASQMNNISIETSEIVNEGLVIVDKLMQKSKETNESAGKVSEDILKVDKRSQEIGSIIETIGQIAQQTNLLALNAAIEAARAGEQGKGFAVVADEVRKLAEESSKSVNEIKGLVEGIQLQSKTAVRAMDEAKNTVTENDKAVESTKYIFDKISSKINSLTTNVHEVEIYSKSMSERKDEIVSVMESLSAVAEETSASAQQVSASTEEQLASMEEITSSSQTLAELSKELQQRIDQFKIL